MSMFILWREGGGAFVLRPHNSLNLKCIVFHVSVNVLVYLTLQKETYV